MLANPSELIRDFTQVSMLAGMPLSEAQIKHEVVIPPHQKLVLPPKMAAVYVFSLSSNPSIVLKVGKAGAKSLARFASQHYLPLSCKSNLAKSISTERDVCRVLGIPDVDQTSAGQWLRTHTDRDHFFIEQNTAALSLFECFLHCRLKPLFEG